MKNEKVFRKDALYSAFFICLVAIALTIGQKYLKERIDGVLEGSLLILFLINLLLVLGSYQLMKRAIQNRRLREEGELIPSNKIVVEGFKIAIEVILVLFGIVYLVTTQNYFCLIAIVLGSVIAISD